MVVALFAIALTARAAYGTTWVSASGTQCQTNDGDINHSMWGAYNPAPYYSDFVCPLPMATTSSYIQSNAVVALKYMDGNSVSDFSMQGLSSRCQLELSLLSTEAHVSVVRWLQ